MENTTQQTEEVTPTTDITTEANVADTTEVDPFAGMSDEDFLSGDWKNHEEVNSSTTTEVPVTDKEVSTVDSTTEPVNNEVSTEDDTKVEEVEEVDTKDNGTVDDNANQLQQAFEVVFKDPIKAAGVELKIDNMEEAVTLIQQGADYTRKMQELSKQKAKIGILEDNGLLEDPEALPRMIEAYKGDPDAIRDLIKKYSIDVTEPNADKEYKPKIAERTEHEMKLNDTISDLKAQGVFENVNTAFEDFISSDNGKGHTEDSRTILTQNPSLLHRLGEDVKDGTYNKVQDELAIRKMKGTYNYELPSVVNYGMAHNELFQNEATPPEQSEVTTKAPTTDKPNPNKVGGTPRGTGKKQVVVTNELLTQAAKEMDGMSDEEYMKIYG